VRDQTITKEKIHIGTVIHGKSMSKKEIWRERTKRRKKDHRKKIFIH